MQGKELKLSFGRRLKLLRELKRLTQAHLAELVGVTEQYLSMIERGLSSPSFDVIAKLCDHLAVDPASLFIPLEESDSDRLDEERHPLDWSRSMTRMGGFVQHLPSEQMEWSLSFKEMLGVRASEERTTWNLFLDRVDPVDRPVVAQARDRLHEGMNVGAFLFSFPRRDGSVGRAVAQAEVESDEYGVPSRIHGVVLDVSERVRMEALYQQARVRTEEQLRERTGKLARTARRMEEEAEGRRRAEEALAARKRMFDALMEAIPETAYVTDAHGRLLDINAAGAVSWGGARQEFIGRDRFSMLEPEVAAFRKAQFEKARATGELVSYRDERDGLVFQSVINPLLDRDRGVEGFVVHARDVTEDDQTVARLRQSEATLAAVLSSAPVGIGLVSENRTLSMVNYRLCEMLGYLPVDVEGKDTRMFYPSDQEFERVGRILHAVFSGSGTVSVETRLVRRDGRLMDVLISAALLETGDRDKEMIFTLLDNTESKQLQTMREDMERVIRHDLRQPVQSVVGVCQLLKASDNLTDKQQMLVGRLEAAASRMLELLNLSLDLHALESGDYRLDPREVDLVDVCRGVLTDAAQRYDRPVEELRLLLNGHVCTRKDCLPVNGDGRLLRSVLENLVFNALEAGGKDGVTVSLENGGDLVLAVHNQECVPQDMRDVFFDKYTTSGKDNGRGLGTYAVRLIAELHGGNARMDCSEKAGTTVTVRLPARASA